MTTTLLEEHQAQIADICRTFRVRRLDVFGSAVRDDFDPARSDVDFLVEFELDEDPEPLPGLLRTPGCVGSVAWPSGGPRHGSCRHEPLPPGPDRG